MCYFLYLATPLTLSEVRSMLPAGLIADLAPLADQQNLKSAYPAVQTVVRLLTGSCSCDLLRPRLEDTREDERHLRERYRRLGVSRSGMVMGLERHRRTRSSAPPGEWASVLTGFIAEHARNAGSSLYLLHFAAEEAALPTAGSARRITLAEITAGLDGWLVEGVPTILGG